MKLELIKTRNGTYKLISTSNHKSPALEHIADLLRYSNKHSNIKIGVYNIYSAPFSMFKTVFSYISGRAERMGKAKFYLFLKGIKQMNVRKNIWMPLDPDKCEEQSFEDIMKDN